MENSIFLHKNGLTISEHGKSLNPNFELMVWLPNDRHNSFKLTLLLGSPGSHNNANEIFCPDLVQYQSVIDFNVNFMASTDM